METQKIHDRVDCEEHGFPNYPTAKSLSPPCILLPKHLRQCTSTPGVPAPIGWVICQVDKQPSGMVLKGGIKYTNTHKRWIACTILSSIVIEMAQYMVLNLE